MSQPTLNVHIGRGRKFFPGISAVLSAFATVAAWPALAHATMLDAKHEIANYAYPFHRNFIMKETAQTFTPTQTGQLTHIALRLGVTSPGSTGTVTIDIRDTRASVASTGLNFIPALIPGSPELNPPGGEILATTKLDISTLDVVQPSLGGLPGFSPLIPLATPVEVTAGTRYAIFVRFDENDTAAELAWAYAKSEQEDAYSGGDGFYRMAPYYAWTLPGWDFGFRTYVTPEPATVLLLVLGGLCLRPRSR